MLRATIQASLATLSVLALGATAHSGGGCAAYANYPPIDGDVAVHSPNVPPTPQVVTLAQTLIILITATLAAIGAAGIPSAGLVTMAIVITAVNSSLQAMGDGIEPLPMWTILIILGIDRILDMCRTAVNVWGDSVGARLITRLAPDSEEAREQAFA